MFKTKRARDWAFVLFYTLFIYVTLPIMPRVWSYLREHMGAFVIYLPYISLAILGFFLLLYLVFYRYPVRKKFSNRVYPVRNYDIAGGKKDISNRAYIWFVIIALLYIYGLGRLELAAEKIHFVQYGVLSCLVFKALHNALKNRLIYLWASVIVFGIGFLDEGIQYFIPNRVYETHDVIVNGAAGVLGQMVIAFILRPSLK